MCYTCSPTCDNCYPKLVKCASCGHVCLLGWKECSECGSPITDAMRQAAEDDWHSGVRLGVSAVGSRSTYLVDLSKLKKKSATAEAEIPIRSRADDV